MTANKQKTISGIAVLLVLGWIIVLSAEPVYELWNNSTVLTTQLDLPKVRGFKVTQQDAEVLSDLQSFVKSNLSPDQKIFVGLNRHDAIIVGDVLSYYFLDQPIGTRYHELHPAIADTAAVQKEIISGLKDGQVETIILRHIFDDSILDSAKQRLQQNVPQAGATDLDRYIQENYEFVESFGPYDVWLLKGAS